VPSEKRARQRAAREAKLAAEAQAKKRRQRTRNIVIAVIVLALVVGVTYLVSNHHSKKKSASTSTTVSTPTTPTTTTTTTTTVPATTTTVNATNAAAQSAANAKAVAAGCPASTSARVNTLTWSSPPPLTIDPSKTYTATFVTTQGTFVATLDAKSAPNTVNNFVFLAKQGYYKCVIFHRVIPQFMDQTGDPQGTGTGGPGYTIKDENPPKASNAADQYPLGSLAMANTGSPNTGGSQFFIVAGPEGEGLPNTYALFGAVTSGMDVVNTINQQGSAAGVPPDVTNRILSVTISES
jgi:cyclophilin family peptidyl-prolyl cis-trans isomerase